MEIGGEAWFRAGVSDCAWYKVTDNVTAASKNTRPEKIEILIRSTIKDRIKSCDWANAYEKARCKGRRALSRLVQ
jgi:hypothetical protein